MWQCKVHSILVEHLGVQDVEEIRKTVFRQGCNIEALGIETHNFEMSQGLSNNVSIKLVTNNKNLSYFLFNFIITLRTPLMF